MHGRTHASQFISSPRKDTPDARTDLFIFVEICRGRMDAVKTTLDGSVDSSDVKGPIHYSMMERECGMRAMVNRRLAPVSAKTAPPDTEMSYLRVIPVCLQTDPRFAPITNANGDVSNPKRECDEQHAAMFPPRTIRQDATTLSWSSSSRKLFRILASYGRRACTMLVLSSARR